MADLVHHGGRTVALRSAMVVNHGDLGCAELKQDQSWSVTMADLAVDLVYPQPCSGQ